jgi:hypothetical protein
MTKHDARIGPQVARCNAGDPLSLAADRGYDTKVFRDELRANGVRRDMFIVGWDDGSELIELSSNTEGG